MTHGENYPVDMAERSKKPRDLNALAAAIVESGTDEDKREPDEESDAVKTGREGGKIGGKARAANMTAEERSEAARRAARARWDS